LEFKDGFQEVSFRAFDEFPKEQALERQGKASNLLIYCAHTYMVSFASYLVE